MNYIQENIRLLSSFNTTDSRTVLTMKTYVLPWAKKRLEECKQLAELVEGQSLAKDINEEIKQLTDGIKLCEQRLSGTEYSN